MRTLLTYVGLVLVVVSVGLFVLMPAVWLTTSSGFRFFPPLYGTWFYVRGGLISATLLAVLVLVPSLRRRTASLLGIGAVPKADGRVRRGFGRGVLRLVTALALVLSPLIAANLLVIANGAWDSSPAVSHDVVVAGRHRSGGGRSAVTYSFEVPSWRADASSLRVTVTRNAFEQASVGTPLTVGTRAGRLGREWVSSWEVHGRRVLPRRSDRQAR